MAEPTIDELIEWVRHSVLNTKNMEEAHATIAALERLKKLANDSHVAHMVIARDGSPIFVATSAGECHEHINDAIDAGDDEAGNYRVRKALVLGHTE